MKFKSKRIDGLTYEFSGELRLGDFVSANAYIIDFDGDLPADYQEITKQEILEHEREQHRLEAKERKDKFDMEKFGRTF